MDQFCNSVFLKNYLIIGNMNISLFVCFSFLLLFASSDSTQIALDKPIELEDAKIYNHQRVELRGFLYRNQEGELVLSHRPDLKSCCIGSKALINQQIFIHGPIIPSSQAITLKGIFQIEPKYDEKGQMIRIYSLKEAEIVPTKHSYWMFFLIIAICLFCFCVYFRKTISS